MVRRHSLLLLIGYAGLAILRTFNYTPMATFRARAMRGHATKDLRWRRYNW
jgi:hypothetical protein